MTNSSPGASAGVSAQLEFPNSLTGRPYSVREIGVEFPPGMHIDFSAVPICHASDIDLYLRGPGQCAGSSLGTATAVVDFLGPGTEFLGGPYEEFFLGDGELIIYERNQLGKPGPNGLDIGPLIFRAPLTDEGFKIFIPEGPSFALPDLLWALRSVDLSLEDTGVFNLPAQRTGDTWEFTVTFAYYIGEHSSYKVEVPIEE